MTALDEIRIYSNRWKTAGLLALSLLLVAAGAQLVITVPTSTRGGRDPITLGVWWVGIVFFGGVALVHLWRLVARPPRIVLDRRGIREIGFWPPGRLMPWEDVGEACVVYYGGTAYVGLLPLTQEQLRRQPFTTRLMRVFYSGPPCLWYINTQALEISAKELAQTIQQQLSRRRITGP